ncbi:MAG: hypothetical protein HYT29_01210, partial [Parcubacteria group bacterium]|nr:hypothetical protein [Parcubacteria group bacterium]
MATPNARFSIKNISPVFIGIIAALMTAFILADVSPSLSVKTPAAADAAADVTSLRITAV